MPKETEPLPHNTPDTQKSIAEKVFGVSDPTDYKQAMLKAHHTLTGEKLRLWRLRARAMFYAATSRWPPFSEIPLPYKHYRHNTEHLEQKVAIEWLEYIFKDQELSYASVLNSWPLYEHLFSVHGEKAAKGTGFNNALLIGARSSVSAKAFTTLAGEVYETDNSYITDIRSGKDKKRPENGTFLYASGLHLPFLDETMHIVQTNYLLFMLYDSAVNLPPTPSDQAIMWKNLFQEAFRVLAPGGQLLMHEKVPGFANADGPDDASNKHCVQEFQSQMRELLTRAGFTNIAVQPGWNIQEVGYLFERSRCFGQFPQTPMPGSLGIFARKEQL